MLEDDVTDSDELQDPGRPFRVKTSTIIWRYCSICGAVVLFAGYVALVGTLAEEFSKRLIWFLSIGLGLLAVFALLVGAPAIAAREYLMRRDSNVVIRTGAGLVGDLIVGLCVLLVFFYTMGVVITLLQLSAGQFLLGDEEIRYRHLMMLSAYAGAFFGISASWRSKRFYEMGWLVSILHGARIFLESAFLAYAGLWLSTEPFKYAASQAKEANWEVFAITLLGIVLIFAGSLSLMQRESQIPPQISENAEQIPFRVRVGRQFQDLKRAISATKRGLHWMKGKFRK